MHSARRGHRTHAALALAGLLAVAAAPSATAQRRDPSSRNPPVQHTGPSERAAEAERQALEGVAVGDDTVDRARRALDNGRPLQTERPKLEADIDRPETGEIETSTPYRSPVAGLLGGLGPLASFVFWGAVILAGLAILAYFVRRLAGGRSGSASGADGPIRDVLAGDRPTAAQARSRLEEADALAAGGRYDEAVHLLLFKSIEDVETARHAALPRALTAREISSLSDVSERARTALRPITALVERAVFAGRPLHAEDYAAARAAYTDFAFGAEAA